jgi:hypothetical protein
MQSNKLDMPGVPANARQSPDPTSSSLCIGELVDGLWSLANGSQRWFPGTVQSVGEANGSVVYTVYYQMIRIFSIFDSKS